MLVVCIAVGIRNHAGNSTCAGPWHKPESGPDSMINVSTQASPKQSISRACQSSVTVGHCRYRPGDRNNRKIFPVVTPTGNFGISGSIVRYRTLPNSGKSLSDNCGFAAGARVQERDSSQFQPQERAQQIKAK
jgi:hypothetical protein